MMNDQDKNLLWQYVTLLTSASTLICCALPSLFVLIGAGAVFATVIETAPFLIVLSEYKGLLFSVAFVALILAGLAQRSSANLACPADPKLAAACERTRTWSRVVYRGSWLCFLIASFVTFVLPHYLR